MVGINCRYNGTSTLHLELQKMINEGKAIAICPEILAGLSTPREPCEIQLKSGARCVIGKSGKDYTSSFKKAAKKTLQICKSQNITKAILQSRSPSCGYGKVYDGNFKDKIIDGNGFTTDLLSKNGIKVFTEIDFLDDNKI